MSVIADFAVPNDYSYCLSVLRIRIRRIRMFLGLPDSDPLVQRTDPDPDPSIVKQK